jgi:hypothetical protein
MAKYIIMEKDMQPLAHVNYNYNLRLPIIYLHGGLLVVAQMTIEQYKALEAMGATIKHSDQGHSFHCFRYSRKMESRLHIWRNEEARKARQELLGSGWHYADYDHQAQQGDWIFCVDGATGTCTRGGTTIHFKDDVTGCDRVTGGYFIDDEAYHRNDPQVSNEMTSSDDVCIVVRISFEYNERYNARQARQEAEDRVISALQGAYIYEPSEGLRISDIDNCG